jgi:uncharacterized protein with beta-barrel porin domain
VTKACSASCEIQRDTCGVSKRPAFWNIASASSKRLALAHDWVSNPALQAVFQALPGSSFIVNGTALPADSALITASAELRLNATWSVLAKFDGEFAPNSQAYAGRGTPRASW